MRLGWPLLERRSRDPLGRIRARRDVRCSRSASLWLVCRRAGWGRGWLGCFPGAWMGLLQPSNGSASAAAAVCRAYRWMVVDALGGSQQRRLTQDTCTYTLVLVLAVAGAQSALHNTLPAYLPVDHDIAAYPLGGLCSLSAASRGKHRRRTALFGRVFLLLLLCLLRGRRRRTDDLHRS